MSIAVIPQVSGPTLSEINNSISTLSPSPNNWTVIASNTFNNTASSYTFSSLSGYRSYKIVFSGQHQTSGNDLCVRFNGDSSAVYNWGWQGTVGGFTGASQWSTSQINVGPNAQQTSVFNSMEVTVENVTLGAFKPVDGWMTGSSGGSVTAVDVYGMWRSTAAITSITFFSSAGSLFIAGNVTLLGAN